MSVASRGRPVLPASSPSPTPPLGGPGDPLHPVGQASAQTSWGGGGWGGDITRTQASGEVMGHSALVMAQWGGKGPSTSSISPGETGDLEGPSVEIRGLRLKPLFPGAPRSALGQTGEGPASREGRSRDADVQVGLWSTADGSTGPCGHSRGLGSPPWMGVLRRGRAGWRGGPGRGGQPAARCQHTRAPAARTVLGDTGRGTDPTQTGAPCRRSFHRFCQK